MPLTLMSRSEEIRSSRREARSELILAHVRGVDPAR